MTKEEKKMKRYTKAIERRLNLPLQLKVRVMSDLISAIAARREAGMTDEEIYAQLGSPKKAAAELNGQMKEFTYRKSPWRYVFAACAVSGGVQLLSGVWGKLAVLALQMWVNLSPSEAASIGIIGGADGPTAIFIATPGWMHYLWPALLLAVGVWGFIRLSRCKQK